ncbi:WYL domain-containing transcriptional regulator [Arthrobacter sp. TS-15]|uniref:helix-turn-helix transcriptional regulator n=1 Tax=Arthrobacter sp. TS-15 TaxID=2510797 RepID=UPI00115E7DE1|nr:WYL domain-containing protein [Arthrobacter sp. TS-15]TQS92922.1 WYL domain-containing transcriptional regulator [Arthrobacter sp. TS-15]
MTTPTSRLLNLLSLLQTRRDWPGSMLAERLEVSDRTVRRDIERLREMGYSIDATMGSDGGYRLAAGSELPPMLFDDDQTVAIAIALQTATIAGAEIGEGAIRALATMRQVMPPRLRHRLDALEVTAILQRPREGMPGAISMEVLLSLATTIRACEVLRFDYAPRTAPTEDPFHPPRRVEPHHLVTAQGRWYLLAWDLQRDDWRMFSADRITPRTPTGPRFTPREVPGGDVNEFVSARFKGANVNQWPCRGTVILNLPIEEVLPFAGDGTVRPYGDDRCTLESGSWSWGSLASSYGRFEVPMEVLDPPQLAEAFTVLANRYRNAATMTQ